MILTKQFLNQSVVLNEKEEFRQRPERAEYDVFLSYSWNDRSFAVRVVHLLEQCGYTVYIDLEDPKLNRRYVSQKTAKRLVEKMKKCKGLLYLYSPSSSVSKWCPWEVGVFSGIKNFRCANLPLVDRTGDNYKNQEYLELYPYVDYSKISGTDKDQFWVCEDDRTYTSLKDWINGGKLKQH